MIEKNHKIVTYISLGGMTAAIIALGSFVWGASAKNTRFEAMCDKQPIVDQTLTEHTTTLALHNTAIAVMNTKLDTIISSQDEIKKELRIRPVR